MAEPGRRAALVAEDDRDIRDLVEATLTQAGFAVTAVGDGLAALDAVRDGRPDIVLLDVMMPGLSGLDVARRLRDDADTAAIPVILLTARSQDVDVENGFALGAADYVIKPFSPRELVHRVNAVLARVAR